MTDSIERFTSEFNAFSGSSLHLAATPGERLDPARWDRAATLDDFIARAETHRELWQTTRRLAHISDTHRDAVAALDAACRLLVLLEDWCGDAIHTVPTVLRMVEANPLLALRVVRRDEHDDLMAAHLTGRARAIPVVIAYDGGPRTRLVGTAPFTARSVGAARRTPHGQGRSVQGDPHLVRARSRRNDVGGNAAAAPARHRATVTG